MHLAAECPDIKMVTYILDKGADVNIQDDDGVIRLYIPMLVNELIDFELALYLGLC